MYNSSFGSGALSGFKNGGTFDSDIPGTFESDTGGTFNPLLSNVGLNDYYNGLNFFIPILSKWHIL